MRQLTIQDRYVTYCEIETTIGIGEINIHSILHVHLIVKKICSRWISHSLSIAQKKARVDWSKEVLQTYDRGASEHVYDIVTVAEPCIYAYEPESKQQSTVCVFQDEPNSAKVAHALSTSMQMIASFFGKSGHAFQETRKTNRRRGITLYYDNARSHTSAQITEFLST